MEIILPEMKGLGGRITDNELGRVHVLLGNVYYKLGGNFKASRNFAHKQWLSAASLFGNFQVRLIYTSVLGILQGLHISYSTFILK